MAVHREKMGGSNHVDLGEKGSTKGEMNNHKQGRSGGETPTVPGPAYGGSKSGNPTTSGGINRATKAKGGGSS
ncbi:hypothetical protein IIA15_00400 [candidate division TA06 bacterium]|nr:hypothetical protein [candidate division TA06 bacterium]